MDQEASYSHVKSLGQIGSGCAGLDSDRRVLLQGRIRAAFVYWWVGVLQQQKPNNCLFIFDTTRVN